LKTRRISSRSVRTAGLMAAGCGHYDAVPVLEALAVEERDTDDQSDGRRSEA
jgi:hypothetical protein